MNFPESVLRKKRDDAVSPVVGVMLMLVVVIIIAAVVSAFAGGTVTSTQKAPSASIEIHIRNSGDNSSSYFTMKVLGVSDPIPSKNLKIINSLITTDKTPGSSTLGTTITGGNATSAGMANVVIPGDLGSSGAISVPTGYGYGVSEWATDTTHPPGAQWGNFTLYSGTSTYDRPTFYKNFQSSGGLDPMKAILGGQWYNLREGDLVAVRILDAQSGKIIVDQNVIVEGA